VRCRAPVGDQPDRGIGFQVAVANDQAARLKAIAHEHEPLFFPRAIRIIDQAGALVQENSLRFLEGDAVLCQLDRALRRSQANSILPTALSWQ
jgi:hypothetical protein